VANRPVPIYITKKKETVGPKRGQEMIIVVLSQENTHTNINEGNFSDRFKKGPLSE
jgi:hypothetical protein